MSSKASTARGKTQRDRKGDRSRGAQPDHQGDKPGRDTAPRDTAPRDTAPRDTGSQAEQTRPASPQLLERTPVGGPARSWQVSRPGQNREPATQPPAAQPPAVQPPAVQPPAVQPPATDPGIEIAPRRERPAEDMSVPLFGGALSSKEAPMRMRHLMALCGWALALTLLGLGVGLWAMLRLMSHGVPGWYEPVIVLTGLAGVGLAIAAFVTADRRYAPWALMGASTAALLLAIGLTSSVG